MPSFTQSHSRRVLLVHWKDRKEDSVEIFSNLLLFCESYPQYSYNTLNNYLSKGKIPFETERIRVERKNVFNRAIKKETRASEFRMERVARITSLHEIEEKLEDLEYWLSKSPNERLAAVTFISMGADGWSRKMDKTILKVRKMRGNGTK